MDRNLIDHGQRIAALERGERLGLKEAKEAVDQLERLDGPIG